MSKVVVGLMVLCVALAVLKMAVVALVVALVLALLVSFVTRPRETVTFVATFLVVGLAHSRPITFTVTIGVIFLGVFLIGKRLMSRRPLLLTDSRRRDPTGPERLDRDTLG